MIFDEKYSIEKINKGIIFDNFIKDKKLLDEINDNKDVFFKDTYTDSDIPNSIQESPPSYSSLIQINNDLPDIQKKLIKEILLQLKLIDYENDNLTYTFQLFDKFEYWTHIHSNEPSVFVGDRAIEIVDSLDWHQNKDEKLFSKEGKLKHPELSLIFWPIEQDVEGGQLEISLEEKENYENYQLYEIDDDGFSFDNTVKIKPKYNRLVIMNPSKWHKVCKVKNGIRWTFVIDIWGLKSKGTYV
jgi:hypothetical protein